MTRNKKLAKRIGCGLLAGTLAFSGIGASDSSMIVKASQSIIQEDENGDKEINFDTDNLTYTDPEGTILRANKYYSKYIKYVYDIKDCYGNKYSGDVIELAYYEGAGPWGKIHSEYCLVNLKCIENPNEATIKKAKVPNTITTVINGETVSVPVIELGEGAFKNSSYETIYIPTNIVKISDYAFMDSVNLIQVVFENEDNTTNSGDNLVELGSFAFSGCKKLTSACIPAQLIEAKVDDNGDFASNSKGNDYIGCNNKFGHNVFRDCISLKKVTIGNSNSKNIEIPQNTFAGCKGISEICFSDTIKNALFGQSAFAGLDNLTDIKLSFDVTLSSFVFANDTNLVNVEFNGNITENKYANAWGLFSGSFLTNDNPSVEPTVRFNTIKDNPDEKINITIPSCCFETTGGLKKVEFSKSIDTVNVNNYAFSNSGLKEIKFDCNNVYIKSNGLSNLGSNTDTVTFNCKNLYMYPESFQKETTTDKKNQVVDNLSLKKIIINSETVIFCTQYYNGGISQHNIFTGVGKNCSLYFGKNVKSVKGTIQDFKPQDNSNVTYEKRNGLGNIKAIYITNPKTIHETGILASESMYAFDCDNDCTIYGYADSGLYKNAVSGIKAHSYKNLKAANYITSITLGNKETIEFVNTKGFDETKVRLYANLANGEDELLTYSRDADIDGYTLTQESIDKISKTNGSTEEKLIQIEFVYANRTYKTEVKMVPKKIANYNVSVKDATSFVEGTQINKTAFDISGITYNDDTIESTAINLDDVNVKLKSGNEKLAKGTNTVIVSYKGIEKEIDITAEAKSITKLTAELRDKNKKYCAGDKLTSDDFIVKAEYNNGEVDENYKNFTVSTNIIPETVTAGTPYVVKISAENTSAEIPLTIATPEIEHLLVQYSGAGVLEGDSINKADVTVIAVYTNGKMAELKQDEYTLIYAPIKADAKNQVQVVYLADTSKTKSFEVTGLKRTEFDPTAAPVATPTLLPITVPTGTPTAAPSVAPSTEPTPTAVVSVTPVPTVDVPIAITPTTTPEPTAIPTTPASAVPSTTPEVSGQPSQTVAPDVVPNTGVTKLEHSKYKLGLKESVKISLTGGKATKFVSSNKKIATVTSKGVVKAAKTGTTTIKVTDEYGLTKSVKITVMKAPKNVKASVTKKTLNVGKKFTIKPKFTKGYYSNKITFSSSNKKVATISKNGVILAKKKGKTTITLKTYNGKKVKVTVTVK